MLTGGNFFIVMGDDNSWSKAAVFITFIIIDFIFFSFGSAIQNSNSTNLEKNMEAGELKAGRILRIINRPGKFVNTIQIVSNLIGFMTGFMIVGDFSMQLYKQLFHSLNADIFIILTRIFTMIVMIIITVSFGIVIPKRLALKEPERWAYRMVGAVSVLMLFITPVIFLVNSLSFLVLKIFGIDMDKHEENVTEEDIMSMVNEGHEQGILDSGEAKMITNIFELNDKDASDVMTHRKSLVCIDGNITLKEAVDFMLNEGNNSRYPVYKEDIDDIIGILNMKDALIYANKSSGRYSQMMVASIPKLLRAAHFIPETRNLDTLFREMQSKKTHMVVVVDEYGQTAGVVTMEDILEEIVGNIMDEYDVDEEMIIKNKDGSFTMQGMTDLEEVAEALDIEFDEEEEDNFDTLNGLIISKLDRIPADNEKFHVDMHGCRFSAIRVENKMIHSLKVEKLKKEEDMNDESGNKVKEQYGNEQ